MLHLEAEWPSKNILIADMIFAAPGPWPSF